MIGDVSTKVNEYSVAIPGPVNLYVLLTPAYPPGTETPSLNEADPLELVVTVVLFIVGLVSVPLYDIRLVLVVNVYDVLGTALDKLKFTVVDEFVIFADADVELLLNVYEVPLTDIVSTGLYAMFRLIVNSKEELMPGPCIVKLTEPLDVTLLILREPEPLPEESVEIVVLVPVDNEAVYKELGCPLDIPMFMLIVSS